MTVIIALICADGLLLAADGQAAVQTNLHAVKAEANKLFCPWESVAWGAVGQATVARHIEAALLKRFGRQTTFRGYTLLGFQDALLTEVVKALRALHKQRVLNPQADEVRLDCTYLFAGYVGAAPFIWEIGAGADDRSSIKLYDHTLRGYNATGSADVFPYFCLRAGLAHYGVQERSFSEAVLVAYRILEDTITVAEEIGPPISVVEIARPPSPHQSAKVRQLSGQEINKLTTGVARWRALERETLTQTLEGSLLDGPCTIL